MKEKNVIGVVGENGAGKDTFIRYFQKLVPDQDVEAFKSGEILMQTLQRFSQAFKMEIPSTRSNLQGLASILMDLYGDDVISRAVYQRIAQSQADIVIFNGVRMKSDLKVVRKFPNNTLVYITAAQEIRYQRLIKRGEKHGELTMSYEQFLEEERAKTELAIPKIGAAADFTITNNGSLDEYISQIKNFLFVNQKILES